MKPPVDPELRKLDAYIWRELFKDEPNLNGGDAPHFTTRANLAAKVLTEITKRLDGIAYMHSYQPHVGGHWLRTVVGNRHVEGIHTTLELAICRFAIAVLTA